MQDNEFLEQFENCTLPKEEFKHRNHLRLSWLYLSKFPLDQAKLKIRQNRVRYATHLGAAEIYNETLTCLWIYLVHQAMGEQTASFDEFISKNEYLLDKNLPLQYYTASRLESDLARKGWLEPDLKTLDFINLI